MGIEISPDQSSKQVNLNLYDPFYTFTVQYPGDQNQYILILHSDDYEYLMFNQRMDIPYRIE